ncbi:MAG TPA: GxxExxY protein [Anaerolineae bacterium]|nr:GxxExxY protein [Anaerolineae bacterium]
MDENAIAKVVVDAAYRVHVSLGPGLLESAYVVALNYELQKRGLYVETEVPIPLIYDGVVLQEMAYRADMIVEDLVVLQLKSVEKLLPVHTKQLLTYLRLLDKRLGLLINFGASRIKRNIVRVANGMPD